VPHIKTRPGQSTAALGALIALVAVPLVPVGLPMLLAALAVGLGWWMQRGDPS